MAVSPTKMTPVINHREESDVPALKLSLPPIKEDESRLELRIDFPSIEKWHKVLDESRSIEKGKFVPKKAVMGGKRLTWTTGEPASFALSAKPSSSASSAKSSSSDDSEASMSKETPRDLEKWDDIVPLLEKRDENGVVDKEVLEQRKEAYATLDGRIDPKPNRDYSGGSKEILESIADGKHSDYFNDQRLHHIRKKPYSRYFRMLRGWEYLRELIFNGLDPEDLELLPLWDAEQRAYLLTMEPLSDHRWVVKKVQNLNSFSRYRLREILREVEKRGWQDVIWVGHGNATPPFSYTRMTLATAPSLIWEGW